MRAEIVNIVVETVQTLGINMIKKEDLLSYDH
jgi:hypothetical protein